MSDYTSTLPTVPVLRFSAFDKEWETVTISKIADKITDGTHDTPKPVDKGVPFLTAIHVKDGFVDYDNCYYLPKEKHIKIYSRCNPEYGDLLMVNIGAGTATSAMVEVDYEFSMKNVALVKPDRTRVDPQFFSQYQRFHSKRLRHQLSSGGAQPFLSLRQIGKLKLVITTLPEQKKIADFLTAVDERIGQLTKKKALLEQYKKGVMQQLFSQTIRFKDDDGNDFPGWEQKRLGEICNITLGQSPDSSSYNDTGNGLPLIQGNADIKNRKSCPRIWTSKPTKICDNGDLLLTVRAPVGAVAKSEHHACLGRGVASIKNKRTSTQGFIYQWLLKFEPRWVSLEQGSTFTAVNGADIRGLPISTPSIIEQTKIANFLSAIDKKIETVTNQITETKTFKRGLLQQMFI